MLDICDLTTALAVVANLPQNTCHQTKKPETVKSFNFARVSKEKPQILTIVGKENETTKMREKIKKRWLDDVQ